MNKYKWLIAIGLSFFCAWASAQGKPNVVVIEAKFGVFEAKDGEEAAFKESSTVPKTNGLRYGWIITLDTALRRLSVREEYLVPNHSASIKPENTENTVIEIRPDRRVQVSQRQLVPVGGKIIGEWEVGPQEPGGRRTLQVIVEDEVAATFEFDVK